MVKWTIQPSFIQPIRWAWIYRPIIFLIIIRQLVKLVMEGGGFSRKQVRMFFYFSFSRFIKYRNGSEEAHFFLQEDLR